MRYTIVDGNDEVLNIIELEPGADFDPPEGCTLVAGREWPQEPYVPPPVDLPAYAAQKRYEREIAGAPWGERVVATDRESQTKLLAEFMAVTAGLRNDPSPWKFSGGTFAMLTNAEMGQVVMAARNHIAEAFGIEVAVLDGIASEAITTTAEIDAAFEA